MAVPTIVAWSATRINPDTIVYVHVYNDGTTNSLRIPYNRNVDDEMPIGDTFTSYCQSVA